MKALTALLLISVPMLANAKSTECEFQQVDVDPFTRKAAFVATERYRLTNWLGGVIRRELGENAEFQVSAIREKDQDYLSLKVRFRRSNADEPSGDDIRNGLVIPEGAQLFILMADDSVTTLFSDQTVIADTRYEVDDGEYVIDSSTEVRYRLDAETAEALVSQDAMIARFVAKSESLGFVNAGGFFSFELAKSSRGYFGKAIGCLQGHEASDKT